ncbi:uncharacterized protein IWZ02DRAFT_266584 [Phyllosticta citriasiana]|uniref:Uncharacterized protein n=1 Tax=Phyllosticta citriasiana TaxID=595635 RepID=A0ABR1KVD9_9PEZI
MGFENIVFFNLATGVEEKCDDVDADIAGIGVVSSFFAAALLTTLASIYAAILDGIIGEATVLPDWINRRLQKNSNNVKTYQFHREVLEKVMISLADQQLLTGYAILISGYIRANRSSPAIPTWDPNRGNSYHAKLRDAHFDLIIFLSCLSASSHLASVLVLKSYFKKSRVVMSIRMTLIVCFTILLAVTIGLSPPLSFGYSIIYNINKPAESTEPTDSEPTYILRLKKTVSLSILVMYLAVASFLVALFVEEVHEKWNTILGLWGSRLDPRRRSTVVRTGRLSTWGFSVLPTVQFVSQLLLFTFALILAASQKFAEPTRHENQPKMCSLNSPDANRWGFGQTLPMFFLLQPVLTGIGEYYDIKKRILAGKTSDKELSSTTNMLIPPPHSPASSTYSLPMHRISLDLDITQRLSGDWHRRSTSMVSPSTRTSYDMAEQSRSPAASVDLKASSRQSSEQKTQTTSCPSTPPQQEVHAASFHDENPTLQQHLWTSNPERK